MARCPHCDEELEITPRRKSNITHVIFLLDETGSMGVIRDKTIDSFNEYIGTLKRSKHKYRITLVKFNSSKVRNEYANMDIDRVPKLTRRTYKPNHMTPLYDAMGETIEKFKRVDYDKILFIVQTDGYENYSKEYTLDNIKVLMDEVQEDLNWECIFIGTEFGTWQKSWDYASDLGFLHSGNACCWSYTNFDLGVDELAGCTISFSADDKKKGKFWK